MATSFILSPAFQDAKVCFLAAMNAGTFFNGATPKASRMSVALRL